MDDKQNFIESIKKLNDYELKKQISYGKDSFREGYYEYLLAESNNRNIEITNEVILDIKQDNNKSKDNNIIKIGYVFAILGGIIGIILGIYILVSKTDNETIKEHKYNELTRKHGINILIIAIIMATFGWRIIIYIIQVISKIL
jgi:hypothetical protein